MKNNKFNDLSKILDCFPYYTKQNLAIALDKDGYNLDYWIKTLIKEKILIPLKKGFYSSSFFIEKMKGNGSFDFYLRELANVLRQPSYISLEYALSYYGLIPEESFAITSITLKSTRTYRNELATFVYRNIKKRLFVGFKKNNDLKMATPAKALFDYLYLKKFLGGSDVKDFLIKRGRINWVSFNKKGSQEFNLYVKLSNSKKMALIGKVINSINLK